MTHFDQSQADKQRYLTDYNIRLALTANPRSRLALGREDKLNSFLPQGAIQKRNR